MLGPHTLQVEGKNKNFIEIYTKLTWATSTLSNFKTQIQVLAIIEFYKCYCCQLFYTVASGSIVKRGNREENSTLYVGNLSYQTTESALAAAFSGCTGARIVTNHNGKSKG